MPTLDAHIVKARRLLTVDVRLHLEQGERLALFGASGAGVAAGGVTIAMRLGYAGITEPPAGTVAR